MVSSREACKNTLYVAVVTTAVACFRTATAQSAAEDVAQDELETELASALVLTDSDAIAFGFMSFDPSQFLSELDEEFGSENSLSRRRSITTFNLPWHKSVFEDEDNGSEKKLGPAHKVRARFSFVEIKQDISSSDPQSQEDDKYKSRIYSLYGGYQFSYEWSSRWRYEGGLGLRWQRYDNDYDYRSTTSQALQGDVAGILFDNSADAAGGSARSAVVYSIDAFGLPWEWQSGLTYYRGNTFGDSGALPEASPEAWTLTNDLSVKQRLPDLLGYKNRLRYSMSRIDLSGDVTRAFGTHYYYRLNLEWLVKASESTPWFDNYGVALDLNIGSAFSGGALRLLYNERF